VGSIVVGAIVAACGGDAIGATRASPRVAGSFVMSVRGVGSGIDLRAGASRSFWMVSDRGSIVGAHVEGDAMVVDATIPLSEPIDAEEVRALPSGGFLVADERGPSVVHVSPLGVITSRFTPRGMEHVRRNRGFEGLALSSDGATAYAVLQSPMGDASDARFADARVVRIVRLDVHDPFHIEETGLFVALEASADEFESTSQREVKVTAAAWIGDGRIALLEHGVVGAKVFTVDLHGATNAMGTALETSLDLEERGPSSLDVVAASTEEIWSSTSTPEIGARKLEGLARIDDATIALSEDDDFAGEPGRVWTIALPTAL
jgi:alkaline phosphatase